jgi:hypothetical protein
MDEMERMKRERYEEMMRSEAKKEAERISQAKLNIVRLKTERNAKATEQARLVGWRGGRRRRHPSRRLRKGSRSRRTRKA